jgi:phage shock protein C
MTDTAYRRLYRSRTNRMLGGVLGGIAEYSNLDPTVVRLLFVLLAFVTGGGTLLAYPVLWVIVPETPQQPATWTPAAPTPPTAPSA